MKIKPITVSSKGQIALPKNIIQHLGSRLLRLETTNDNEVRIVPVTDVAGSLSKYAKHTPQDFSQMRKKAWEVEVAKKHQKDSKND